MKLYTFPPAPNPARVGFFLNEKALGGADIPVERVLVNFLHGEQKSPEHLARNPSGTVPVLALDDGSFLTESLPIMEYLEERYPDPPLIGTDAQSRARTRTLERQIELGVLLPIGRYVHATKSPLGLPPNPAIAEAERARLPVVLARLDAVLTNQRFVMGEDPSMADCTLLAALNFGRFADLEAEKDYPNVRRWFEAYALRHL
ncbi:MAG TPA: glutathione S-transferase family protein [Pseudomonadales bacterium]